ncbi:DUF664 domain-containing protein [Glutamicibacter sp.]|uniref:mycothiol transferase n=1 Tax=Glutamicibacter sp. TaxID=1931995 RepID=UPI0028BE9DCB|nr:DUF664 domain-containing protein [Glutamicibacter sp.]
MTLMPPKVDSNDDLPALLIHELRQVRASLHGLTTEQAASHPTASALSLSGIAMHCAQVAHGWLVTAQRAPDVVPVEHYPGISAQLGFMRMHEGLEDLSGTPVEDVQRQLDRCIDFILADGLGLFDVDVRVPLGDRRWPGVGDSVSGIWVWQHLIAEVARHAGHADILRESIDRAVSPDLTDLDSPGANANVQ